MKRRRSALAVGFSVLVFAASVGYIAGTFRWRELAPTLSHVSLAWLVGGGGGALILYWMLRTLRWRILLRRTDTHVPLLDLHMCTAVSLSFALFTPLQSGELLKIELLKKYGLIQRSPGYGSFLVERALDLVVLFSMACISLLITLDLLANRAVALGMLGSLALIGAVALWTLAKLRPHHWMPQVVAPMRQCLGDLRTVVLATAITFASWAVVAFSWQVFLYSGGLHLGFTKSVALMSLVTSISVVSLIPGGLGVTEAGAAHFLRHVGFDAATAQAGSIVLRAGSLLAIALGAGHLAVWRLIRFRDRRQMETAAARATAAGGRRTPSA